MHYADKFTDWFSQLSKFEKIAVGFVLGIVILGGAIPSQGATLAIVGIILILDWFTDSVLEMHN